MVVAPWSRRNSTHEYLNILKNMLYQIMPPTYLKIHILKSLPNHTHVYSKRVQVNSNSFHPYQQPSLGHTFARAYTYRTVPTCNFCTNCVSCPGVMHDRMPPSFLGMNDLATGLSFDS